MKEMLFIVKIASVFIQIYGLLKKICYNLKYADINIVILIV